MLSERICRRLSWGVFVTLPLLFGAPTVAEAQNVFPPTGWVGIGTTSPQKPLHVVGSPNNNPLVLQANGSGTTSAAGVQFWNAPGTQAIHLGMELPGSPITNDLIFSTYSTGIGWVDRFHISNANGNVGIALGTRAHRFTSPVTPGSTAT